MLGIAMTAAAAALLAGCAGGAEAPAPAASAAPPAPGAAAAGTAGGGVHGAPAGAAAAGQPARPAPGRTAHRPARPVIGKVWTTPGLDCDPTWCHLPAAAGTVTFHARVTGATRVEFFLVPTGTGTAGLGRSLGVDRDGRDGWSVRWAYPNEPLLAHLTVVARGPGGRADKLPFNLHHPEPAGPTIGRVWTEPALSCRDAWCSLPAGAGSVVLHADVRDALGEVVFWLDPIDGEPVRIGADGDRRDGYSVRLAYVDQPLRAYVRVVAGNNLGQRTSTSLGLVHS